MVTRLQSSGLPLAGPSIYAHTPAHLRADKAISTLLTMRDRLFTLTKLPRTLSETGKVTLEQLDEVAVSPQPWFDHLQPERSQLKRFKSNFRKSLVIHKKSANIATISA